MSATSPSLPATAKVLQRGMERGLHIGYQLAVVPSGGAPVLLTGGEACPGVPMTSDTLMPWLSAGKPLTAMAIARQVERGGLDLDRPVAELLPAFGRGGKEQITPRHLLVHAGGFRYLEPIAPDAPWDEIIRAVCAAKQEPRWETGVSVGYHPYTSWFILGELVRLRTGRPFAEAIRDEVLLPAGMPDTWFSLPADRRDAYGDRIGHLQDTADPHARPRGTDSGPVSTDACSPGASARGPIRELAGLYALLLSGGGTVVRADTVAEFTRPHRTGVRDRTFRFSMAWGLGFMVNPGPSDPDAMPYGFGRHASPQAYGHGGAESSHGFADPGYGFAAAWVCNGTPGPDAHHRRNHAIQNAIYRDLGFTGGTADA